MKGYSKWIIVSGLLLSIAAYLFLTRETSFSSRSASVDFSVKDTASITRILIKNPLGDSLLLARNEANWIINNRYRPEMRSVKALIYILHHIDIKSPVPKSKIQEINDEFETKSTSVKIYEGDRVIKTLYLLDSQEKGLFTYIKSQSNNHPFIAECLGIQGTIGKYFVTNSNYWRDKTLFNFSVYDLKSVDVRNHKYKEKSFSISSKEDEGYVLFAYDSTRIEKSKINNEALMRYLSYLNYVEYIGGVMNMPDSQKDSILSSVPISSVSIRSADGQLVRVSFFPRTYKNKNNHHKTDYNYLYGEINDNQELVLLKYMDIDPILKDIDYFIKPE